eukprot:TRINITY_DN1333_c0_g1_i5.p2 TRINITY_DN1333_c0_g1~~TRINITY_DN1333_c0_g1_i5.p2  ORF type:complete len:135 (-),score=16.11 TRINITY_DN1333_c0_g1_i5:14-418(-)
MVHAGDAAKQEDDGGEQGDASSFLRSENAELHKKIGCDDSDEDFEHALHPHVDDPEAPVVHDGEVAAWAIHEACAVEGGDKHGGEKNHHDKVPLASLVAGSSLVVTAVLPPFGLVICIFGVKNPKHTKGNCKHP